MMMGRSKREENCWMQIGVSKVNNFQSGLNFVM
jgi:hypothetical protein